MILHVVNAKYVRDFMLRLEFNDGAKRLIDLANELHGEVLSPLQDVNEFKKFQVDPELNTVVWENGADFAPEFLDDRLLAPSEPNATTNSQ